MIKASGRAYVVQDVLAIYVPCLSDRDTEPNMAMHGVYSNSGDRFWLCPTWSSAEQWNNECRRLPDYRNSLEKVKQIGVLRGSGISLHGNVAPTAVVNNHHQTDMT